MRNDTSTLPSTRAAAIADLLSSLEVVLISCQVVPDADRGSAWDADADRITGEVARHLATARARLSPSHDPYTAPVRRQGF
jgi:hypothetical protein